MFLLTTVKSIGRQTHVWSIRLKKMKIYIEDKGSIEIYPTSFEILHLTLLILEIFILEYIGM